MGRGGGAHARQLGATAGVVLSKKGAGAGPCVEQSELFVPFPKMHGEKPPEMY